MLKHTHTAELSAAGVSIWLDDLSRERITSGSLAHLVATENVVGVTTNPSIFAQAITSGSGYEERIAAGAAREISAAELVTEMTCEDVADACDVLMSVFEETGGRDGWVSIEVDPALANDVQGTIDAAEQLHRRVNKPNVMIKIPATEAGVEAVAAVLALGISVNVTLIFSLERYRKVINAHLAGLERARRSGLDISAIHSVASFFVSRFDTAVQNVIAVSNNEQPFERFTAAVAHARLAYEIYAQHRLTARSQMLCEAGAPPQRLLWASTGTKDASLDPTYYVSELCLPDTVNTMPAATLAAVTQSFLLPNVFALTRYSESDQVLNTLVEHNVDYLDIVSQLEQQAITQFQDAWMELHHTVQTQLQEQK